MNLWRSRGAGAASLAVLGWLFGCGSPAASAEPFGASVQHDELGLAAEPIAVAEGPLLHPTDEQADDDVVRSVGVPPFSPGVVEAEPGYAELVAALNLASLPLRVELATRSPFANALLSYMLGFDLSGPMDRETLWAAPFGRAVLLAATPPNGARPTGTGPEEAGASEESLAVNLRLVRRGLHHFYGEERRLPSTLDALRDRVGDYTQWPSRVTACSPPKNGPRRVFENEQLGVAVAETLEAEAAGGAAPEEGEGTPPHTTVRETEVIFADARADGQLDFAVYGPSGERMDRSTFATRAGTTATTAAPYTCLTCHVRRSSGRFDVLRPFGTGAGCQ